MSQILQRKTCRAEQALWDAENKVSRCKVDINSDMFTIYFSSNEKRNGVQSAPINRDEKKTGRRETAETSVCHNIEFSGSSGLVSYFEFERGTIRSDGTFQCIFCNNKNHQIRIKETTDQQCENWQKHNREKTFVQP